MPCIDDHEDRGNQPGRDPRRARRREVAWLTAAILVAVGIATGCASRAPAPPPPTPTTPGAGTPGATVPPVAGRARDWRDFQRQAANRLVQANPGRTYLGTPPEVLLAIPVLEVELNGNGSVRGINVMRQPGQALDTVQLAMDAVHRAAPFGDVSHLPRPWRFTETFLFDDQRRFKPRTLD